MRFLLGASDEYASDEYKQISFRNIVGWDTSLTKLPSPEQMLQYAACGGFISVLDTILASNPDLDVNASTELGDNASTEPGKNALVFACERRHWQIADTLLKRGADPNEHTVDSAPLFHASTHGADDIVQKLITHGADVNVLCEVGYSETTPLTAVIEAYHPSTIELLLVNGADPNLVSIGETSMAVAARYGRHECMEILLKHGASLKALRNDDPSLL